MGVASVFAVPVKGLVKAVQNVVLILPALGEAALMCPRNLGG